MKKLLIGLFLVAGLAANAAILTTNVSAGGVYLLSTARANVYSIELSGASAANLVQFYDSDTLDDPYYGTNSVSAAYTYRTAYTTNIASSFTNSGGYVTWSTNAGLYTVSATQAAATNALTPLIAHSVAPNTIGIYNVDALFVNGITMKTTTNITVVINYRSGQ